MKRFFKGILVSFAVVAAMLLPNATAAQAADVGDGNLACNSGEICFQYIYGSSSGLKHFWYSDMNHSDNYFHNGQRLMDNIQGYWNRDTACNVKMYDVSSSGAWFVYKTLYRGGTNYRDMGSADYSDTSNWSARDRNNGHYRC